MCGIVGILLIAGLPVVYIDGDDNLMMSGDPIYKLSKRRHTYMEMVKDTVIPVCIPSPCDIDIVAVLYTPRMERACPYLPKLSTLLPFYTHPEWSVCAHISPNWQFKGVKRSKKASTRSLERNGGGT